MSSAVSVSSTNFVQLVIVETEARSLDLTLFSSVEAITGAFAFAIAICIHCTRTTITCYTFTILQVGASTARVALRAIEAILAETLSIGAIYKLGSLWGAFASNACIAFWVVIVSAGVTLVRRNESSWTLLASRVSLLSERRDTSGAVLCIVVLRVLTFGTQVATNSWNARTCSIGFTRSLVIAYIGSIMRKSTTEYLLAAVWLLEVVFAVARVRCNTFSMTVTHSFVR